MALAATVHSLKPGAPSGLGDASSPLRVEEGSPPAAATKRHCLTPIALQGKRAGVSPAWGLWVQSKEADPSAKGATGLGKR